MNVALAVPPPNPSPSRFCGTTGPSPLSVCTALTSNTPNPHRALPRGTRPTSVGSERRGGLGAVGSELREGDGALSPVALAVLRNRGGLPPTRVHRSYLCLAVVPIEVVDR